MSCKSSLFALAGDHAPRRYCYTRYLFATEFRQGKLSALCEMAILVRTAVSLWGTPAMISIGNGIDAASHAIPRDLAGAENQR
jgi:hypothetical protein